MLRMQLSDVDDVLAIEQSVYAHPWSRSGFVDSLRNSDDAWVARNAGGELIGYVVQMTVIDESHLLTIAVKGSLQRQGFGLALLRFAIQRAHTMNMKSMMLEVRVSNLRALQMYRKFGFVQIGQRKNYYQADHQQREDALILRCPISSQDNGYVGQ